MQSRFVFGLGVICVFFSLANGARINLHTKVHDEAHGPDGKMEDDVFDCVDAVAQRTDELVDRLGAYFGQCEVSEEHLIEEGTSFTVTDEGKNLLCKESCKGLPSFATDALDSSFLLDLCDEDTTLTSPIRMHNAFDEARKSCAEAPLIDVEDEDTNAGEISTEEVVDLPVESPVAPMKGKRIKQQQFEYELKNALAERSKGDCATLKSAFKLCDYKRTGAILIKDVDRMLDLLEENQKVEALDVLKNVAEKAGKAATEALTFKDWTQYKLDLKEGTICALEYAMKK